MPPTLLTIQGYQPDVIISSTSEVMFFSANKPQTAPASNTDNTGGSSETRPINVYVYYIIKY